MAAKSSEPKHLSLSDEAFNDALRSLGHGLANETDRGLALVASQLLDDALAAVLRRVCSNGDKHKLFDAYGPLSTFAARIDLSCAIGLIGLHTKNQLKRIKDIRNRFAHSVEPLTFDDRSIADKVAALRVGATAFATHPGESPNRRAFLSAVEHTYVHLFVLSRAVRPRQFLPMASDAQLAGEHRDEVEATWTNAYRNFEQVGRQSWFYPLQPLDGGGDGD